MRKILTIGSIIVFVVLLLNNDAFGQSKIKAYFNQPVNTSLATFGIDAAYLPSATLADTIAAYIGRAKYTVDIAQYDYNQDNYDGNYTSIAAAVDTAYAHGITVRWIYDASASNHGLSLLNPGIHTLGRPVSSSGDIMHNKFIIIDANSSNPEDAILSTGSEDWSSEMFYKDFNNRLFIQDSALASAYTLEFNMMWGSTTAVPDSSLAEFGTAKTPIGINTFHVDGHLVELYFSPSDNPDSHIASTILTANKDLYVGVYDITRTGDATDIVNMSRSGVYTLAVVDPYTPTSSPSVNSILSTGLGSNYVVYNGYYLYHNKMMIVDPSDTCSDPMVLTGSENWTSAGTNYNDENIVIIHSDTLANLYYQYFISNFTTFGGGSFAPSNGICGGSMATTAVQSVNNSEDDILMFPNPATTEFTISSSGQLTTVAISDLLGQTVYTSSNINAQKAVVNVSNLSAGVYLVKVNGNTVRKFIKE